MMSTLLSIDSSLRTFLNQITESVGFIGFLAIVAGIEFLFVALFVIKSVFSYEARLKRRLDKCNTWLFKNKKLDTNNIKAFNDIVKKGPKRFSYYWQQFILNREGGPAAYMTEENIISKPLKTSSWKNNARNLGIVTIVWSIVALIFGLASQAGQPLSFQAIAVSLVLPCISALIGTVAIIIIHGTRVLNLDDLYYLYNIFARFVTNACDELPPYIDFNLLFTPKQIEKGIPQIRQYYEEVARKAKEEFEAAQRAEQNVLDFNFKDVGVDGALLLERAMKESEMYISSKNSTLSRIAQIEAEKDALKRNFETVQMDLQRKLQASKENIANLIEQQATTTNRFDIGRLRERQDKEVKRQEQLQADYDQEEARYLTKKDELEQEVERLSKIVDASLEKAEKGMEAEYETFFKKVMKSAYSIAENKVIQEKNALIEEKDKTEGELIIVQTQIKRLLDENVTLRAKLEELTAQTEQTAETQQEQPSGSYDAQGNFVYEDGSYHDTYGLFHDVDGKVYDMNGILVAEEEKEKTAEEIETELYTKQEEDFGSQVKLDETAKQPQTEEAVVEETTPQEPTPEETVVEEAPKQEPVVEEVVAQQPAPEETTEKEPEPQQEPQQETKPKETKNEKPKTARKTTKPRPKPRKTVKKTSGTQAKKTRPVSRVKKNANKPESTQKRGRGRPRTQPVNKEPVAPKKRGRPRKNPRPEDLDQISGMINEEEGRIKNLQSELDKAVADNANFEKQKEELTNAINNIKVQADQMKQEDISSEELARINGRIEELINRLSSLNK